MYQGFDENKAKKFGRNLRAVIERSRLKYTDIAKALDVSVSAVSNWTNGSKIPRRDKIAKICTLLDVTQDELFGDEEITFTEAVNDNVPDVIASYAKTEAEYLKEKYLKLDSYGKHTVKIVLEAEYSRCAQQRKK